MRVTMSSNISVLAAQQYSIQLIALQHSSHSQVAYNTAQNGRAHVNDLLINVTYAFN